jgi:hypothetical protein
MSSNSTQNFIIEAIQKALDLQQAYLPTDPFFWYTYVMGISSEISLNISNVRFAKKLLTGKTRTLQKKDGTEYTSQIYLYVVNKNESASWILTCANITAVQKNHKLWVFSEDVEDDVNPKSSIPAPPFPPARVVSKLQGMESGKRPSTEQINPDLRRIDSLEQEVESLKNDLASLREDYIRLKEACIKMMF